MWMFIAILLFFVLYGVYWINGLKDIKKKYECSAELLNEQRILLDEVSFLWSRAYNKKLHSITLTKEQDVTYNKLLLKINEFYAVFMSLPIGSSNSERREAIDKSLVLLNEIISIESELNDFSDNQ